MKCNHCKQRSLTMSKRKHELKKTPDAEFSKDFRLIRPQRTQAVLDALYARPGDPAEKETHRAETMRRLGQLEETMYEMCCTTVLTISCA